MLVILGRFCRKLRLPKNSFSQRTTSHVFFHSAKDLSLVFRSLGLNPPEADVSDLVHDMDVDGESPKSHEFSTLRTLPPTK